MANVNFIWYLVAILGVSITSSVGIFIRKISKEFDYLIVFTRFSVGLLCLIIWFTLNGQIAELKAVEVSWPLILSGVILTILINSYVKAIRIESLASASFLLYLGPLIAAVMAPIFTNDQLNFASVMLLVSAFIGALLIININLKEQRILDSGAVFGLISGLMYGIYILLNNKQIMGEVRGEYVAFYQFMVGSLIMIPFLFRLRNKPKLIDIGWSVFIGLVHGFLGLTLQISSFQHLNTIEYGTISYVEPLSAAILGLLIVKEKISKKQIVGCILVLVSGVLRVYL
ncbi:MAG: DMT family transporter [Anaerolineales bacterium]|jgi:drug/metabolite transporter (DMT)-like permease